MRLHAPKHDVLIGMGCKWHYSLFVGYLLPFVSSLWIHYLYYTSSQKTRHANFKIKLHRDRAPSINFSTKKWLDNAVEMCFKILSSKAWPTVTYPYPQDSLPTLFPSHPELVSVRTPHQAGRGGHASPPFRGVWLCCTHASSSTPSWLPGTVILQPCR